MIFFALLLASLAGGTTAQAIKGFNYGSTFTNNVAKQESDFEAEFRQAQGLSGAPGFTSARIYTTIQGGTTNSPISAIPAAIATNTHLLLGLWASAGQDFINNEIAALTAAINQYGTAFTSLIDAISVGSEDLYRISPTGIENNSGVGAAPADVANYISQVRAAIANTPASGKPVGHVDTWTAWVNNSNQAVIDASDFIGMDAYPYFQNTIPNGIDIGQSVFNDALDATRGAVGSKPVWVTETGWPVSGPQMNQAVASIPNAQTYWQQVACQLFSNNVNTYWYTLQDALPDTPSPSFGLVGTAGGETPLYDLSCSGSPTTSSAASGASSSVAIPTGGTSAPAPDAGSPGASSSQVLGDSPGVPTGSSTGVGPTPTTAASGGAVESGSDSSGMPTGPSTSAGPAPTTAGSGGATGSGSAGSAGSEGTGTTSLTTYTTETECPITVTGSGGTISTILSTSTLTVTSCAGGCAPTAPQPGQSQTGSASPPTPIGGLGTSGACPASLSGPYEYPHLMVPIDKDQPDVSSGTSYNGTFSSTISTIFNFDIPQSDSGKTCTLVFLLPDIQDLETSSYTLTGSGGIDVKGLEKSADQSTTYNNAPVSSGDVGSVLSVAPGNSYTIASGACAAGQRIGYKVGATGGLSLTYFQDYNPSPLGLYITVC